MISRDVIELGVGLGEDGNAILQLNTTCEPVWLSLGVEMDVGVSRVLCSLCEHGAVKVDWILETEARMTLGRQCGGTRDTSEGRKLACSCRRR